MSIAAGSPQLKNNLPTNRDYSVCAFLSRDSEYTQIYRHGDGASFYLVVAEKMEEINCLLSIE